MVFPCGVLLFDGRPRFFLPVSPLVDGARFVSLATTAFSTVVVASTTLAGRPRPRFGISELTGTLLIGLPAAFGGRPRPLFPVDDDDALGSLASKPISRSSRRSENKRFVYHEHHSSSRLYPSVELQLHHWKRQYYFVVPSQFWLNSKNLRPNKKNKKNISLRLTDVCSMIEREERNEQRSIGSDIPLYIIGQRELNSAKEENGLFKMVVSSGNVYRFVL